MVLDIPLPLIELQASKLSGVYDYNPRKGKAPIYHYLRPLMNLALESSLSSSMFSLIGTTPILDGTFQQFCFISYVSSTSNEGFYNNVWEQT